ncbi:SDR family oxidoreductase [Rapidithrix thailandica]|uniref:SDR family oxidoreductase n=1 Tax=Rapidithrix thailandica TaxID=413964 RepID=A0AAW9SCN8_9BACT
MKKTILVIGATGNLSRDIVVEAASKGFNVKAATRHPEKYQAPAANVQAVKFEFETPETFDNALKDVDVVSLVALPLDATAPQKLRAFIEAVKAKGINRLAFTSAIGVNLNEEAPLRKVERLIYDAGIPYSILRPNFFMENFSRGFIAGMIQHTGGFALAAEDAKTSFISTKDIAKAVVQTLLDEKHKNKEFTLTGSSSIDHQQAAEILSKVSGKTIRYQAITEEQMIEGSVAAGLPQSEADYLGVLYSAVRAGYTENPTPDLEQITGEKGTSFEEFAKANAEVWK